ncbi:Type IV pilus biogenesis and competence protein PilQ precursor [Anaerohalosphaera lusitana]|uniref:Type IV pilus biogenesis and competence protein PilQ n=1 Tax=Anaerohalosphaera lusitana TaxID=1936003 RepID=A0A1U9NM48_9BACT|nr:secretin N-terminal domain-containing protein [Anaerohalosphaera lusitana]AQT68905.1 Type IV pilus biogenesis and competence protein PilQ precursor [Anaerohalosphaera lusitana]
MKKNGFERMKSKMSLLAASFVLVTVVISLAWAEEGAPEVEVQIDETVLTAEQQEAQQKPEVAEQYESSEQETISASSIQSISFNKDMTIKDALRFLAMKYHKNIVPTAKVDGMITVTNLYDVTFEEALQAVIGPNKYDVQGNFIMVYTPEEFEQYKDDKRRMEYRVFELYYINAEEAKKLITPLMSENGQLQSSTASEIGVSGGDGLDISEGGDALALHDSVVVKDYPENIEEIDALLKDLDKRPVQVLVEATILSANLNEGMEYGVNLNLAGGLAIDGGDSDTVVEQIANFSGKGNLVETAGFANAGGNGLRLGIRSGDVSAFISALEGITDVTVLANPKILALNKQVGTVFIGQKLGYRSSTSVSGSGVATEGQVEFLNSGTKLSFRPYVGSDGYVRMDIYPKDSSAALNDDGVPTETTAELTSNIMVKDGQTVVIGGLFRDDISSTRSQVPVLGDIPVIGAAFRGIEDVSVRQEVIVMLTPHVIEDPSEVEGEERAEDIARKRYAAREGLQKITRTKRAEKSYIEAAKLYRKGLKAEALREVNWALHLRPTYLEALRLRERILDETDDNGEPLERIMIDVIEEEDTEKWMRL